MLKRAIEIWKSIALAVGFIGSLVGVAWWFGVTPDNVGGLACVKGCYRVRSAYPADAIYIEKIKRTGRYIERIPGR